MKSRDLMMIGIVLSGLLAVLAPRAEAADYNVVDQVTFNTFLAGIGGTGSWAAGTALVNSGVLPAGSTLTIGANVTLRPQVPGGMTNQGSITINSTGRGFYGAGNFVNEGSLIIVAAVNPENYASIVNAGLFQTAIPFGNYGTFINRCQQGSFVGTNYGSEPITSDCPVPVQPTTWGQLKVRYGN